MTFTKIVLGIPTNIYLCISYLMLTTVIVLLTLGGKKKTVIFCLNSKGTYIPNALKLFIINLIFKTNIIKYC